MSDLLSTCLRLRRQIVIALLTTASLAVAGCDREPKAGGQTIATVNDAALTTSDLNIELSSVPPEQRKQAQPKTVQSLVDRKILSEYAKSQGMDRSPDFVLEQRRLTDVMLADRAARQIVSDARRPITINDINRYLDTHPAVASNRRILSVDQIQFATPEQKVVSELGRATSLDEVVAILQRNGIEFRRAKSQIDTATLSDPVMSKFDGLAPGEPLVTIGIPQTIASVIIGVVPASLSGDAAEAIARQRITTDQANTAIQQKGLALRREAKITYAKGFDPAQAKHLTP